MREQSVVTTVRSQVSLQRFVSAIVLMPVSDMYSFRRTQDRALFYASRLAFWDPPLEAHGFSKGIVA